MGMEGNPMFLEKDRFLTLADGTVMDLKTRKPVSQKKDDLGCWGSRKMAWGRKGEPEAEWGDPVGSLPSPEDPSGNLAPDDLEYAKLCRVMDKRIRDNMSAEQKELLASVDKILGPSKLVEESRNG